MASLNSTMLTEKQMLVVSVIEIVTSFLSMLGASSIIWFSVCRRKACLPEVFPVFQLSLADLLASVFMFVGCVMFLTNRFKPLDLDNAHNRTCEIISGITKSFYISTFMLTTTYAVEALMRMRDRLYRGSGNRGVYSYPIKYVVYSISWILPLTITVVLLALSEIIPYDSSSDISPTTDIIAFSCSLCLPIFHYNEDKCWENMSNGEQWHDAYRLLFVVPFIAVMAINLVLYIMIYRTFKKFMASRGLLGYHQRKEESHVRNQAIMYQVVFAVCWLPSLVLGLVSLISGYQFNMQTFYWLYIWQALAAPLQGFCNSVLYGWKRDGFKQAINEQTNLTSTNIGGFYSSVSL